ncbi:MAG: transcriptional regulator, partial [Mariniphaga sp.]|nr:transcriptional regulator [Mariniphaga sp.]
METLKYTVIKDAEQYKKYCDFLEELILNANKATDDEIELLTLLIEKWDNEHSTFNDSDPIVIL